jgi:hypothetical protein
MFALGLGVWGVCTGDICVEMFIAKCSSQNVYNKMLALKMEQVALGFVGKLNYTGECS